VLNVNPGSRKEKMIIAKNVAGGENGIKN